MTELNLDLTGSNGSDKVEVDELKENNTPDLNLNVATSENLPAELPDDFRIKSLEGEKIKNMIEILPEHEAEIERVVGNFDINDTNQVLMFAVPQQTKHGELLEQLMGNRSVDDMEAAGDVLIRLKTGASVAGINEMKEELTGKNSRLGRFFKGLVGIKSAIETFVERQKSLQTIITDIKSESRKVMAGLVEANARNDIMYKSVGDNFYVLGIYIHCGEMILERAREELILVYQEAERSNNPMKIGERDDLRNQITDFDVRLFELKAAWVSAPMTMKEIRMAQRAGRISMQGLVRNMTTNLNELLSTINIILSLCDTKKAQENFRKGQEMADELGKTKGDLLGEVYLESAKQQSSVVDAVDRCENQLRNILSICEKAETIRREDAIKRVEGEEKLAGMVEVFRKTSL
ncbi:toxic anion resistance protein [Patescibacteria group bacterium]